MAAMKKKADSAKSDQSEPIDKQAEPDTCLATDGDEPAAVDTVDSLRETIKQLDERLLRARAEYSNFQRRSAIERTEGIRYANADLMRSLLTVLDDFERSLAAMETADEVVSVADGIKLIHANLVKALTAHGLESIEAVGKRFDPNIHEALLQEPSAEHEPGTVVKEISTGYRLRGRVIRPTRVIVAGKVEASPTSATASASGPDDDEK